MREFLIKFSKNIDIPLETIYSPGSVYVVRVLAFFRKTGFLLSSKQKNTSKKKPRPIIIIKTTNEISEIVGLSSNMIYQRIRPYISLEDCNIKEKECFGLDLKRRKRNFIFGKKNKKNKIRFKYPINIHILYELEQKGDLIYCGKCSDEVTNEIISKIEKDILEVD